MRCLKCKGKAVIELRRHNAAYCGPHFLDYFGSQARRNIQRHSMFRPEDRILIAVSGGKDSLALWDLLLDSGYQVAALHLHLGIGDYSARSREVVAAFAQKRGSRLIEVDIGRDQGMGVTELSRTVRRAPCSACGLSKRYFFNREAVERGFDVIATGHNLDDEAATLLGNVLQWHTEYMARQSPVLESTHPRLARKVKPFYTLTERETALYCILRGIEYVEEECPNARGAKSLLYKDVLNRLEEGSPGAKQNLLTGFFKRLQPILREEQVADMRQCLRCGQPTPGDLCAFCRMWDLAAKRTAQNGAERTAAPTKTRTDSGESPTEP